MTPKTVPQWTLEDRLRKARQAAGLSQGELADIIGVARQTVSNSERGTHRAVRVVHKAWAEACGVPIEWLMTGEKLCPVPQERLDYVRLCVSLLNDLPPDDRFMAEEELERTVRLILAEIDIRANETRLTETEAS